MKHTDDVDHLVLADQEIEQLVRAGRIIVENFDSDQLSGCAYDLRADATLSSRNRGRTFNIAGEGYVVEAGEIVTVQSLERLDLSNPTLVGFIGSHHTHVSQGLYHPFTVVDPGFAGPLSITLYNQGNSAFRIKHGDRIAKLVLARVGPVKRSYGSQYRPRVPEGSMEHSLYVDRERSKERIEDLSGFLGGPLGALVDRVGRLESNAELYEAKKDLNRFKSVGQWILLVLAGAIGGLLTLLVQSFLQSSAH